MFYYVMWKPRRFAETLMLPTRFASAAQAILEASVVLAKRPDDVWIEDEAGVKIIDVMQIAEYTIPAPAPRGRGFDARPCPEAGRPVDAL